MATTTALLRPNPTVFHPTTYKISRSPPLCCRSKRSNNHHTAKTTTSLPENYKLLWQEELKRANPAADHRHVSDAADEEFQEWIDKRCVENLRMLIVDAVQHGKAGHPGMAMGMAEVGYQLYRHVMRYNPCSTKWLNRDRFVLSAGHGCLLQYVCLHLAGFQSLQIDDLQRLCKLGSRTPGHPENVVTEGIEVTTVPSFKILQQHRPSPPTATTTSPATAAAATSPAPTAAATSPPTATTTSPATAAAATSPAPTAVATSPAPTAAATSPAAASATATSN